MRFLLVRCDHELAAVDLKALVQQLHRNGLVSFLVYDPLVCEKLESLQLIVRHTEWHMDNVQQPCVLLTETALPALEERIEFEVSDASSVSLASIVCESSRFLASQTEHGLFREVMCDNKLFVDLRKRAESTDQMLDDFMQNNLNLAEKNVHVLQSEGKNADALVSYMNSKRIAYTKVAIENVVTSAPSEDTLATVLVLQDADMLTSASVQRYLDALAGYHVHVRTIIATELLVAHKEHCVCVSRVMHVPVSGVSSGAGGRNAHTELMCHLNRVCGVLGCNQVYINESDENIGANDIDIVVWRQVTDALVSQMPSLREALVDLRENTVVQHYFVALHSQTHREGAVGDGRQYCARATAITVAFMNSDASIQDEVRASLRDSTSSNDLFTRLVLTANVLVKSAGSNAAQLVSFQQFVREWPYSIVCTQQWRVIAFLLFLERQDPEALVEAEPQRLPLVRDFDDTIQLCALANFAENLEEPIEPGFLLSKHAEYVRDDGTDMHLLVSTPRRLDYNHIASRLQNYPYGEHSLLEMLRCGAEPVLYLLGISSQSLVRILPPDSSPLQKLDSSTRRCITDQVIAMATVLAKAQGANDSLFHTFRWVRQRLALLKWVLLISGECTTADVSFSSSDLSDVLRTIEITTTLEASGGAVLNMVLALDDKPEGHQQAILQCYRAVKLQQITPSPHTKHVVLGLQWAKEVFPDVGAFESSTGNEGTLFSFIRDSICNNMRGLTVPSEHPVFSFSERAAQYIVYVLSMNAKNYAKNIVEFIKVHCESSDSDDFWATFVRFLSPSTSNAVVKLQHALCISSVVEAADVGDSADAFGKLLRFHVVHFDSLRQCASTEALVTQCLKENVPFMDCIKDTRIQKLIANDECMTDLQRIYTRVEELVHSTSDATEVVDIAFRLMYTKKALIEEETTRFATFASAAWCLYPDCSYMPPLYPSTAATSSSMQQLLAYVRDKGVCIDLKEKKGEVGAIARCIFLPRHADPYMRHAVEGVLPPGQASTQVQVLEVWPGREMVSRRDPQKSAEDNIDLAQRNDGVISIHSPVLSKDEAWYRLSEVLDSCVSEADIITEAEDQWHCAVKKMDVSHGWNDAVLRNNCIAYLSSLLWLKDAFDTMKKTTGESESGSKSDALTLSFTVLWYLEHWFTSFGCKPLEVEIDGLDHYREIYNDYFDTLPDLELLPCDVQLFECLPVSKIISVHDIRAHETVQINQNLFDAGIVNYMATMGYLFSGLPPAKVLEALSNDSTLSFSTYQTHSCSERFKVLIERCARLYVNSDDAMDQKATANMAVTFNGIIANLEQLRMSHTDSAFEIATTAICDVDKKSKLQRNTFAHVFLIKLLNMNESEWIELNRLEIMQKTPRLPKVPWSDPQPVPWLNDTVTLASFQVRDLATACASTSNKGPSPGAGAAGRAPSSQCTVGSNVLRVVSQPRTGTKFDAAARTDVMAGSNHFASASAVALFKKGNMIVDGRELLSKTRTNMTADAAFFEEIEVVNGAECYFVLRRGCAVNRINRFEHRVGVSDSQATAHRRRLPYDYIAFEPTVRNLHEEADADIIASFPTYRSAWMFLDEHLGDCTLVVVGEQDVLFREHGRQWEHRVRHGRELDRADNASVRALFLSLHAYVPIVPACVKRFCDLFAPPDGSTTLPSRIMDGMLGENGSLSKDDFVNELKNANHPPKNHDDYWNLCRQVLCNEEWLDCLFGSKVSTFRDDLVLSFGQEGCERKGKLPDLRESETVRFFDLFRSRRDVAIQYADTQRLVVGVSISTEMATWEERGDRQPASMDDSTVQQPLDKDMWQWMLDVVIAPFLPFTKQAILSTCYFGTDKLRFDGALQAQDELIATTIIQCCPVEHVRRALEELFDTSKNGTQQDTSKLDFIQRRDSRYGIVVCSDVVEKLRKIPMLADAVHSITIEVSDTDSFKFESVFLNIVQHFNDNCHIVYVRGIRVAPDSFMKWCCEFTHRSPWRYIYFENLHIAANYPEIRDRCRHLTAVPEERLSPSRVSIWHRPHRIASGSGEHVHVATVSSLRNQRESAQRWSEEIKEKLLNVRTKRAVVLLVSPPGVGKTKLALDVMKDLEKKAIVVHRFDCSDDRLVVHSIVELLESQFVARGMPAVLIADEFHLLNPTQKSQLFAWFSTHLSWLSVLLIGNRVLRDDKALMAELRCQQTKVSTTSKSGNEPASTVVEVCEYEVQRVPNEIQDICCAKECVKRGSTAADNLLVWYWMMYLVFGKTSLSLRDAFALCANPGFDIDSRAPREHGSKLAAKIREKQPLVSSIFSTELVKDFMATAVEAIKNKKKLWDVPATDPNKERSLLATFCSFAFRMACKLSKDESEEGQVLPTVIPFADFSMLSDSQQWNPKVRVEKWIRQMERALHVAHPVRILPNCQHCWLDQDPIPYVCMPAEVQTLAPMAPEARDEACAFHLALGVRGVSHSISSLREQVTHLQPVDWTEVEAHWAEHPLTDLYGFESLLQDCANRVLPFEALMGKFRAASHQQKTPRASGYDLCMLAERSAEHDASGIGLVTNYIIEVYDLQRRLTSTPARATTDVALLYATWRVLLCVLAGSEMDRNNVPEGTAQFANTLRKTLLSENEHPTAICTAGVPQLVLDTLLWAGTEGSSFNTLYAVDDKAVHRLTRVLVAACNTHASATPQLWTKSTSSQGSGHHAAARLFKDLFRTLLEPALERMPIATVVCVAAGIAQSGGSGGSSIEVLEGAACAVSEKQSSGAVEAFFKLKNWTFPDTLEAGGSPLSGEIHETLLKQVEETRNKAELPGDFKAALDCLKSRTSE
eukprot:m.1449084 g.1449084  ORF g.1449084 m.1449084 type:complete len:2792 (-) comp25113_c0_seq22:212-8587(-)